jgi:hypothetical protein
MWNATVNVRPIMVESMFMDGDDLRVQLKPMTTTSEAFVFRSNQKKDVAFVFNGKPLAIPRELIATVKRNRDGTVIVHWIEERFRVGRWCHRLESHPDERNIRYLWQRLQLYERLSALRAVNTLDVHGMSLRSGLFDKFDSLSILFDLWKLELRQISPHARKVKAFRTKRLQRMLYQAAITYLYQPGGPGCRRVLYELCNHAGAV